MLISETVTPLRQISKITIMEKKVSGELSDAIRQENILEDDSNQEVGGRRQSVAHNVIENPLKVSAQDRQASWLDGGARSPIN